MGKKKKCKRKGHKWVDMFFYDVCERCGKKSL